MSVITEKSPKHCANKQSNKFKFNNKIFIYLSTLSLTLLSLIFLVWFVLHPKNPRFSLKDVEINTFNSSIHLTLVSTNPNNRVGILYDELHIHASYDSQMITHQTPIPPLFQDHDETNFLSASLIGHQRDPSLVPLEFKLTGKLRWKVGNYVSKRYRVNVICVTNFPFGNVVTSQGIECSTSVN